MDYVWIHDDMFELFSDGHSIDHVMISVILLQCNDIQQHSCLSNHEEKNIYFIGIIQ